MPQLSVEVHNTLHLAAGRRMHLRLEGVVKRVPRMCDVGLRGVPFLVCGTVLIRERDCIFLHFLKWLTWEIKLEKG